MRISVIILLAAISIVNASPFHIHKRAVPLQPCTPPSDVVLTGTIDPDPAAGEAAKAKLSFTTAADAPKLFLTTTVTDGGDAKTAKVTTADLCAGGLTCPVPKGQEVDITSSTDVPDGTKAPQIEYNINDGTTTIACAVGKAAAGAAPPAGGAPPKGKDAPKDGAPKDAPKDGAPKDAGPAPPGGAPPPPDGPGGPPPPPDGAPAPPDGPGGPPPPPPDGPGGTPPPPPDGPGGTPPPPPDGPGGTPPKAK